MQMVHFAKAYFENIYWKIHHAFPIIGGIAILQGVNAFVQVHYITHFMGIKR